MSDNRVVQALRSLANWWMCDIIGQLLLHRPYDALIPIGPAVKLLFLLPP